MHTAMLSISEWPASCSSRWQLSTILDRKWPAGTGCQPGEFQSVSAASTSLPALCTATRRRQLNPTQAGDVVTWVELLLCSREYTTTSCSTWLQQTHTESTTCCTCSVQYVHTEQCTVCTLWVVHSMYTHRAVYSMYTQSSAQYVKR